MQNHPCTLVYVHASVSYVAIVLIHNANTLIGKIYNPTVPQPQRCSVESPPLLFFTGLLSLWAASSYILFDFNELLLFTNSWWLIYFFYKLKKSVMLLHHCYLHSYLIEKYFTNIRQSLHTAAVFGSVWHVCASKHIHTPTNQPKEGAGEDDVCSLSCSLRLFVLFHKVVYICPIKKN